MIINHLVGWPIDRCSCYFKIISPKTSGSHCVLWSIDTLLPESTIGHNHESLVVTGSLLHCEGRGKLFAHVLNLSTFVSKNFILTIILHHLRKSFIKLLLQVLWKLLPLPPSNVMTCSSQFRQMPLLYSVETTLYFSSSIHCWRECFIFGWAKFC